MKAAKYLIVASSDYLYTPRSLFWPDVIFLTAPKLDWGTVNRHDDKCAKGGQHGAAGDSDCRLE